MPDIARNAGAYIVATGRSDFANQVNNALVFPGMFRGALDNKVKKITDKLQIKVAKNLAGIIKHPNVNKIIPSIFDAKVVKVISQSLKK